MNKSKSIRIVFIALSLTIIAWFAFKYSTSTSVLAPETTNVLQEKSDSQLESDAHKNQTDQKVASNEKNLNGEVNRIELEKQFHSASTAYEAQKIIDNLYAEGFDKTAAELEGKLSITCSSYTSRAVMSNTQAWIGEKIQKYCGEFTISDEDFADTMAKYTVEYDIEVAELKSQFQELSTSDRNMLLREKIASASSWREIELLKIILRAPPHTGVSSEWVYDLGQDSMIGGDRGRDMQVAALQMLQCEQMGSYCGANSIATINECYRTGLCLPGWTMRDFYYNTLSPIEYDEMDRILNFFKSLGG